MGYGIELTSCNILEKDINNDILWAWIFPSIHDDHRQLITRKCGLDKDATRRHPFTYSRLRKSWFYIQCTEACDSSKLPQVKSFALVLWAKDFNPEKYEMLCRMFSKTYYKTGTPTAVLEQYLGVLTKGQCVTDDNGMFSVKDYQRDKFHMQVSVRDLIKTFGLESILIYTAILLKRKILFYHHNLKTLLKLTRAAPFLMLHRDIEEYLYPWVELSPMELTDLKGCPYYIAGSTEAGIEKRTDLYDLFVNLAATEIAVAPHAKDAMTMTKIHKDIALFMVRLSEDVTIHDEQIANEIANKTKDILSHLRTFATVTASDGRQLVSLETLKEKNLSPALENFLFNLAMAEGILML